MKLSKTDKTILAISCPIFMLAGTLLAVNGYVAGIISFIFGIMNYILVIIGED